MRRPTSTPEQEGTARRLARTMTNTQIAIATGLSAKQVARILKSSGTPSLHDAMREERRQALEHPNERPQTIFSTLEAATLFLAASHGRGCVARTSDAYVVAIGPTANAYWARALARKEEGWGQRVEDHGKENPKANSREKKNQAKTKK